MYSAHSSILISHSVSPLKDNFSRDDCLCNEQVYLHKTERFFQNIFIFLLVVWYSGRYAEFAMYLNDKGYGVFGMDWIGNSFLPI